MFDAVETQLDLLDISPEYRDIGFCGHFFTYRRDIVTHRLDRAGDKADYVIVVRFRHQSHASTSLFFALCKDLATLMRSRHHAAAMSASLISKLAETFCTSS
jgi:hypothetical protein